MSFEERMDVLKEYIIRLKHLSGSRQSFIEIRDELLLSLEDVRHSFDTAVMLPPEHRPVFNIISCAHLMFIGMDCRDILVSYSCMKTLLHLILSVAAINKDNRFMGKLQTLHEGMLECVMNEVCCISTVLRCNYLKPVADCVTAKIMTASSTGSSPVDATNTVTTVTTTIISATEVSNTSQAASGVSTATVDNTITATTSSVPTCVFPLDRTYYMNREPLTAIGWLSRLDLIRLLLSFRIKHNDTCTDSGGLVNDICSSLVDFIISVWSHLTDSVLFLWTFKHIDFSRDIFISSCDTGIQHNILHSFCSMLKKITKYVQIVCSKEIMAESASAKYEQRWHEVVHKMSSSMFEKILAREQGVLGFRKVLDLVSSLLSYADHLATKKNIQQQYKDFACDCLKAVFEERSRWLQNSPTSRTCENNKTRWQPEFGTYTPIILKCFFHSTELQGFGGYITLCNRLSDGKKTHECKPVYHQCQMDCGKVEQKSNVSKSIHQKCKENCKHGLYQCRTSTCECKIEHSNCQRIMDQKFGLVTSETCLGCQVSNATRQTMTLRNDVRQVSNEAKHSGVTYDGYDSLETNSRHRGITGVKQIVVKYKGNAKQIGVTCDASLLRKMTLVCLKSLAIIAYHDHLMGSAGTFLFKYILDYVEALFELVCEGRLKEENKNEGEEKRWKVKEKRNDAGDWSIGTKAECNRAGDWLIDMLCDQDDQLTEALLCMSDIWHYCGFKQLQHQQQNKQHQKKHDNWLLQQDRQQLLEDEMQKQELLEQQQQQNIDKQLQDEPQTHQQGGQQNEQQEQLTYPSHQQQQKVIMSQPVIQQSNTAQQLSSRPTNIQSKQAERSQQRQFQQNTQNPRLVFDLHDIHPHILFIRLLESLCWDHMVALDWLTSPETCFLLYLSRQLKRINADWSEWITACDIVQSESKDVHVDYNESCSSQSGTSQNWSSQPKVQNYSIQSKKSQKCLKHNKLEPVERCRTLISSDLPESVESSAQFSSKKKCKQTRHNCSVPAKKLKLINYSDSEPSSDSEIVCCDQDISVDPRHSVFDRVDRNSDLSQHSSVSDRVNTFVGNCDITQHSSVSDRVDTFVRNLTESLEKLSRKGLIQYNIKPLLNLLARFLDLGSLLHLI